MSAYFRQDYLETPDGASLFFQVQGPDRPAPDGSPSSDIVLCDGLGCDGFVWKYVLPALRVRHRVLRWHYRGHGRSGLPDDRRRIGLKHTCEDLDRVMEAVGMERAAIFGHSMGVQVALELHHRFRDRVTALVLIAGSYGNPLDTIHDVPLVRRVFPFLHGLVERFPRAAATVSRVGFSTQLAVRMGLELETNKELMKEADLIPYFRHLSTMDPLIFTRTLQDLSEHSAWAHLPHVDVPTLVLAAGRDTFTPPWLSARMAHEIPSAELEMFEDGSHTLPLERPADVNRRIERFLSRQSERRAG